MLWFQPQPQKTLARVRLFCFPYAGGGVSIFRAMLAQAPTEIEICPIYLPGREQRLTETPFSSVCSGLA